MDVLIAGGGIAGLLLARALRLRGRSVLVANDPAIPAAAQAAVGLLNPVTGPRFIVAWQSALALPVAHATYRAIERECAADLLQELPIVRVLRDDAERTAWNARAAHVAAAGFAVAETAALPRGIRPHGNGAIAVRGAGVVDAWALIDSLRRQLVLAGAFIDQRCDAADLVLRADGVNWRAGGVEAGALVLAGGAADVRPGGNVTHYVKNGPGPALPLRAVKGETVLVHAPELPADAVFMSGHFLAPRGGGRFVCGATQEPDVDEPQPTADARAEFEAFLRTHVEGVWTIEDQRAGVRPATPDLRPIVGRYLSSAPVYVFNGLGSRGFALGPWLADALAAHLVDGTTLPVEVAPARFAAE